MMWLHTYKQICLLIITYNTTVCLLVPCSLPKGTVPQSKSLNEISPNPMGLRDRQSTLRFEKSISALWKKILSPNKSCWNLKSFYRGKNIKLVSELLDNIYILYNNNNSFVSFRLSLYSYDLLDLCIMFSFSWISI
jgi:hypothetical protein